MTKKRIAWTAVFLCFAFAVFAAGMGDPADDGMEKIAVTYTSWRTEDEELQKQLDTEFMKDNPEIQVRFRPVMDTEYDAVLQTKLASKTAEDLVALRGFDAGRRVYDGGFVDNLTSDMIPIIADIDQSHLGAWNTGDGVQYGLPINWVATGFLYNERIFEENNLTVPQTVEEFMGICEVLSAQGITPLAFGIKDLWPAVELLSCNVGPNFFDGENWRKEMLTGNADFKDARFIAHLEFLSELSGYMPRGFESLGYFEYLQVFAMEEAAIMPSGSWEPLQIRMMNEELKFGYFQAPVVNKGDKSWIGATPALAYGLNKDGGNKDAALTYLNWLSEEKGAKIQQNMLAGLFSCFPNAGGVDDPVLNDWLAAIADSKLSTYWTFDGVSREQPGAGDLMGEIIYGMWTDNMTPPDGADYLQDRLSQWFEPLQ